MMRYIWVMALALAGCGMGEAGNAPMPAQDFATYCAACHGAGGRGNGPAAAGLTPKPANLRTLSLRNGGAFPATRVMAFVWGDTTGNGHRAMPEFAPLMQGALIQFDGGDGIETPTPERLVALAEYLKQLQDE